MVSVPTGGLAVMQNRRDPVDSLDFFPTPPWATRALCEIVLPEIYVGALPQRSVWEPACGAGHMAEVLGEYFESVHATDVHSYGYGGLGSFVGEGIDRAPTPTHWPHWIITNPPFNLAGAFVERALREATHGVAMLTRTSWLEGGERYRTIFKPHPPSVVAQFCERVPMVKDRWDPSATTATSYAWVIWLKRYDQPTRFVWIPPGQRKALTRASDVERFAQHTAPAVDGKGSG